MNDRIANLVQVLTEKFHTSATEFRGDTSLIIDPRYLVEAVSSLRADHQFDMLVGITAVDYWPQEEPRFHIVYHFYSTTTNLLLELRAPLNGNAPMINTVETVYPNANWYEREIWDMFGVRFDGHSDLRRILMPQDWQGHPQRKDYPLGYEEVQFTFNFNEISLKKPAPRE